MLPKCLSIRVGILMPLFILLTLTLKSQDRQVSGKITSSIEGTGLSNATIAVKNSRLATQTDKDGNFRLTVPASTTTLVVTSVGFTTQEIAIPESGNIALSLTPSSAALDEVVVVGYGTARRRDLTGSVATVTSRDFQRGVITTPEQLIAGKVAGVQITSNGGAPGSGSRIRIRGGSSLNASNDPLIVVDGVPLDNSGIAGVANPLSLINPNDIESFNILKDASATAIYGSRASNGVIIITTKKGSGGGFRVNLNSNQSISRITKQVDVLSASEFRTLINAQGTAAQIALMGKANTNWQDEIYRSAFSTDNMLSLTGGLKWLPYRLSLGYLNQDGVLLTDKLKRTSAALSLNPKFFDNHLSIDINLKGSQSKSNFADQGAIGTAVFFDPTHPVRSDSAVYRNFGGYYEWLDNSGNPNTLAPRNPVSLLRQGTNKSNVLRSIGNIQFDYKLHFLPELRANLNLGYDVSESEGSTTRPATLATVYTVQGTRSQYTQKRSTKLMEFYLNYAKDLTAIRSRIDATGGYSYQDWLRSSPSFPTLNGNGTQVAAGNPFKTQNTLISFFGRMNYTLNQKYLLTGTIRRDGSSRFSPDNRWGVFPSGAVAWKINEEAFLKDGNTFSDLKLRIGYGVTGQQDIGGDFPYLARYSISDSSARYQLGNTYYPTLRPAGYDENIKWEETQTWNTGLDFGFLGGRLSGSLDYYFKKTKDLLAVIAVPAGSNFTNRILTNVGNIENKGIELSLNGTPVDTKNFTWEANLNFTYNTSTITNLSKVLDSSSIGIETGGIGGGVGNTVQIHSVGYSPNSFYVYKQVYNQNGVPIEGLYVDQDKKKDGTINLNDKSRYKSPNPKYLVGFSSQLRHHQWSLAFTMRGQIDNYMYNNFKSNNGTYANFRYPNYLGNVSSNVLETNFQGTDSYRYWSDYYIENASFLRMDNINLGYNVGKLVNAVNLRLSATVQNVFTITRYSGLDPEIASGIDNNFYPRPRVFSIGANLDF